MRGAATFAGIVAVVAACSSANDSLPQGVSSCSLHTRGDEARSYKIAVSNDNGTLTEALDIEKDRITISDVFEIEGRTSSATAVTTSAGTMVDGQQDGHVFHLTSITGQPSWSGTVDGRPIVPFNRPSNADTQPLVVRFADDGKAVVPSTTTPVEALQSLTALARQAQQHCVADSGQEAPLSSPAVPAEPRGNNAIPGCGACKFGCANGFLGCGVTTGIACAGLLFVPFIGPALFIACEAIGILVCVIQEVNCAIGCNASDQCCPLPCGSKCCNQGAMCADKANELCCDSGTTASGDTCCDNATEQTNPAGGCCLKSESVCGKDCCDLQETACATDKFHDPGTVGQECCPNDRLCSGLCCNNGFACNVTTSTCNCPTVAQVCGKNCCGIGETCTDAKKGSCCPATHVCGKNCCPNGCDALGTGCCPGGQACGLSCCAAGQACTGSPSFNCCSNTVCSNTCCGNNSPCTNLSGSGPQCCGSTLGSTPCGPKCCTALTVCVDPVLGTCK